MTDVLLSIVIPAFNAEGTVCRAIRSALAQPEREIEIIVVDDGSRDRTRECIVDLMEEVQDERLILMPPMENVGLSAARNLGVASARGQWVAFLDADDEFEEHFAARMLAATYEPRVGVVACSHWIVQVDGTRRMRSQQVVDRVLTGEAAAMLLLEDRLTTYAWDKIYRRDILGSDPFPVGIDRAEDLVAVFDAFLRSSLVVLLSDALHTYYVSSSSLTWSRVTTVENSETLMRRMHRDAGTLGEHGRGRRAMSVLRVLTFLNTGHQAIAVLDGRACSEHLRDCARSIRWGDCVRAARTRPAIGAAAILFKAAPRLYARAYERHIGRAYSVDA